MFEVVQNFHQQAKVVLNNIYHKKFRVQNGKVKLINFSQIYNYLDEKGTHLGKEKVENVIGHPIIDSIDMMLVRS